MDVKSCKKCGRLFNSILDYQLCDSCKRFMESSLQRTEYLLKANPSLSVEQLAEEAGVEISTIHEWIENGSLILPDNSSVIATCKNCGARISSGQYCDSCKQQIRSGLRQLDDSFKAQLKDGSTGNGMHGKMHSGVGKRYW